MSKHLIYLEELIDNTITISSEKKQSIDKHNKTGDKSVKFRKIQAELALEVKYATQEIRAQKEEVEKQKSDIEEAHKKITDSLAYAKRIQSAILPPERIVKRYLKESFIFYKPKDIVSGDFYWMETVVSTSSTTVYFAVADCTGHGVPGAMVSVLCNNALNRAVREYHLTDPGKILDKAREIVIQEFEKAEEEVKDGMDISLCRLTLFPSGEIGGGLLQWAGANNPLYIVSQKSNFDSLRWKKNNKIQQLSNLKILELNSCKLFDIEPDKQPIGKCDNPVPFSTHSFYLQKGDSIYIFSDGYVDQFGGEKGKKYKTKAFKELLLSIQNKTMSEQLLLIENVFDLWKGNLEQVDDVCIIGVRL